MSLNTPEQNILGEAPEFLLALEHVSRAAPLSKPVLILGERGTGKELFANRLHYLSTRWDQPLVKVNCAALTESILESELFGHEAGAFTGAATRHTGRFERADKGTLLLDELGTIPQRMQEKILRVIEYGEFERVGGSETIFVDVRIVGATNADLPQLAAHNKFRIDLLDRLAFDVINVPPLRHRRSDIELLAHHFAVSITSDLERSYFPGFTETATMVLNQYNWPGNVRELKNAVERSVYRNTEPDQAVATIVLNPFETAYSVPVDSPASAADTDAGTGDSPVAAAITLPCDLKQNVRALERRSIEQALEAHQYHQGRAAQSLSLTYHQLRAYLKKYDIQTRPK